MKETLKQYIVLEQANIIDALRQIEMNKKDFLIVLNQDEKVRGVLTNGDIHRALVKGYTTDTCILKVCSKQFVSLRIKDTLVQAMELFKNYKIKFIPIIADDGTFYNILTKDQLYSALLLNIQVNLSYDFNKLDEQIMDYEIFLRPWGFYKTCIINQYLQSKIISVKPGQQLSLQSHRYREEHWIVTHGTGLAQIDESIKQIDYGSLIFIPKGAKHRLTNTDDAENLIIIEVQLGEYFGEDDIVRYEDRYGRT